MGAPLGGSPLPGPAINKTPTTILECADSIKDLAVIVDSLRRQVERDYVGAVAGQIAAAVIAQGTSGAQKYPDGGTDPPTWTALYLGTPAAGKYPDGGTTPPTWTAFKRIVQI